MRVKTALLSTAVFAAEVYASSNPVGSKGYQNFSTTAFTLELDVANQVASRLISLPGSDSGSDPFNFLLPVSGRQDDGHYFLGDIQIRVRPQNGNSWTDLSSHYQRQAIEPMPASSDYLASAAITPSFGGALPISVQRTWTQDRDSLVLSFNITNTGSQVLEFGGVGMPIPINNNWTNQDQETTWQRSVVSDPAISLDAGYVITNRLTGNAPTLVTTPTSGTPLEQYRLNLNPGGDPGYPDVFTDPNEFGFEYEGIFSWWMATSGLLDIDQSAASSLGFSRGSDWNTPTSFILQPGSSRILGLRFFTAAGPRAVEDRLAAFERPTIVGVPGFVVPTGEQIQLLIRSSSSPSIAEVSPAVIAFDAPKYLSDGFYSIVGTANSDAFGETRITINFANGEVATAHANILSPFATQVDRLGQHRFANSWFTNTGDYFDRSPGIISYDNSEKAIVLDDPRAWVAGMSDEAGTGAYVSAAAKQLGRPNKSEIEKLEAFAAQTLFGKLQISTPGDTYGGVKKSLFYYDSGLEGPGIYDPSVDHSGTWPQAEADRLDRSYNYPHPLVVYWVLYRLARNYDALTTNAWTWYIDRAYDTIVGMQNNAGLDAYSQFGLMEDTYFQMVLLDLQREGSTNDTLASRAQDVEDFMKQRADIWSSEAYPYASEFPWDNTAQEGVYAWTSYFGYLDKAEATIETLMAIMASVPHWGYSGTGRDLWDFLYSGKIGPGARIERIIHHYKGAQSALPLINQFQIDPTDIKMLRAGYGGVLGPLTSIGADGFGSTGFHTRPDYLAWDPLSGDNGVTIALHALSTRAIAVNNPSLGGWAGFGAAITEAGSTISIRPYDSFRQRLFIAENALYMELDAGHFTSVTYDTSTQHITVVFDQDDGYTPNARLRWTTTASTANSGNYTIEGGFAVERGCSVVPLSRTSTTTVTLSQ